MIIDSNGRLFGKVNVVDILIIIVIMVAIFGAYKYATRNKAGITFANENKIEIQFLGDEVPEYVANSVEIGTSTSDFERNTSFGKVINKEVNKSLSIGIDSKGEYVQTSKPGYSSVKLIVEGKGVFGSTGVTVDNFEYNIGKTIILKAGKTVFSCRICDIKTKE